MAKWGAQSLPVEGWKLVNTQTCLPPPPPSPSQLRGPPPPLPSSTHHQKPACVTFFFSYLTSHIQSVSTTFRIQLDSACIYKTLKENVHIKKIKGESKNLRPDHFSSPSQLLSGSRPPPPGAWITTAARHCLCSTHGLCNFFSTQQLVNTMPGRVPPPLTRSSGSPFPSEPTSFQCLKTPHDHTFCLLLDLTSYAPPSLSTPATPEHTRHMPSWGLSGCYLCLEGASHVAHCLPPSLCWNPTSLMKLTLTSLFNRACPPRAFPSPLSCPSVLFLPPNALCIPHIHGSWTVHPTRR